MRLTVFIIMVIMSDGESQKIQMSLENWMRDLPEQLKNIPFIYLAIPGSHDSMTYGITRSSELAPDAEPVVRKLYPLFRGSILRWTVTQAVDAAEQLRLGIRYLDLRLATKNGTNEIFFTHGVYASEISGPLQQVQDFIESHPDEVVILDFQHFYGFKQDVHLSLIRFLLNKFGRKLVTRQADLKGITLNSMRRLGQQVIIVYRHESVFSTGEFWLTQMMPSPWPRQDLIEGLVHFFENVKRSPTTAFVHQAVLTPTPAFIVVRWTSSLREKCAIPVKNEFLPILTDYSPGPPSNEDTRSRINVVIADFIDLDNAVFSKNVIQLNFKLLNLQNGEANG